MKFLSLKKFLKKAKNWLLWCWLLIILKDQVLNRFWTMNGFKNSKIHRQQILFKFLIKMFFKNYVTIGVILILKERQLTFLLKWGTIKGFKNFKNNSIFWIKTTLAWLMFKNSETILNLKIFKFKMKRLIEWFKNLITQEKVK